MTEKTLQKVPPHPTESGAAETALTPAERAERELVQIDEEMDAILGNKSNRAALVNSPGQALKPPQGRSVTPSVAPPIEASSFSHFVLNCIVPGSGSLLHKNYAVGVGQLSLAVASVPTLIFYKLWLALLLAVVAYVWSVASGMRFLGQPSGSESWK